MNDIDKLKIEYSDKLFELEASVNKQKKIQQELQDIRKMIVAIENNNKQAEEANVSTNSKRN